MRPVLLFAAGLFAVAASAFAQATVYVPTPQCSTAYFIGRDGQAYSTEAVSASQRRALLSPGPYSLFCEGMEGILPSVTFDPNVVVPAGRTDYTPPPTRYFVRLFGYDYTGAPAPATTSGYLSQISIGLPPSHGNRRMVAGTRSPSYRVSEIPPEFSMEAFEIWGNVSTNNYYIVAHEPQHGLARDLDLVTMPSRLWPARVEYRHPRSAIRIEAMSTPKNTALGDIFESLNWTTPLAGDVWRGTLWTTRQDGIAVYGRFEVRLLTPLAPSPGIFYNGGSTVAAYQNPPRPTDPRIPENKTLILGAPPYWLDFEVSGPAPRLSMTSFFFGPLREQLPIDGARVTVRDENGNDIAYFPNSYPGLQLVPVSNRYTVILLVQSRPIGGVPSQSEVTATVSGIAGGDVSAPSLWLMRAVDPRGEVVDVVRGSGSALEFGATDLHLDHTKTRVFWRKNGTADWVPLAITSRDEATGFHRVDLSTVRAGLVDLRIDLGDTAGNTASWTGTPALVVETPARGRAVRK